MLEAFIAGVASILFIDLIKLIIKKLRKLA